MALVVEDDVLDLPAEAAELLDHLVGLALDDARVGRALDHEQRSLDVVDVRDRRPLHQEICLGLRIAHEPRDEALPRRRDGLRKGDEIRRAEDVHGRRPVARQPRHARQHGEAAVRAAVDADPAGVDPVLLLQPFRGVLPVLHVAAAPVPLHEALVRLAVASRAADVGGEHADAAGEQVLIQRLVQGTFLRFRPTVDRQHDGRLAVEVGPVQPGRNLPAVEAREADQLDVHEIVFVQAPEPALGHGPRPPGARLDHPRLRRAPGAGDDQRRVDAVR